MLPFLCATWDGGDHRNRYRQMSRVSDYTPMRMAMMVLYVFVCLTIPMLFYTYMDARARVSRFITAAKAGELATVTTMLKAQPSLLNAPGYLKRTTLWWAASEGRVEVMTIMIMAKADVNLADANGEPPLFAAAAGDHLEVVKLLNQHKVKLTALDARGRGVLFACARGRNLQTAAYFHEKGISVNAADKDGWSPLHVAVDERQHDMVAFLIEHGANVNAKTTNGETPLSLAKKLMNNDETLDLLVENGATD